MYNVICSKVGCTVHNVEKVFNGVAENIFEDGLINWGRIIALLGFSVKVSQYLEDKSDQIVDLTVCFIVDKTGLWIQSKGGWKNVIVHFNSSSSSRDIVGWFVRHTTTTVATISLGILVSCINNLIHK
ncbi:apoptosis regulator R1-like [Paramuricea clavata]|uniref:Apoptosis regulator R1-like n=1 Tax=Paramuricea clavata TaxID=317549 RepID=A0A7D9I9H3_PARCT|nr:apoptosis regulator R1-like [Paramuricea clavata]